MAEVTSVPVGNLVLYGVAVVAPTLGFWLVLKVSRLVCANRRRRREARVPGPPIERLAADLRRVHRNLTEFAPGTPYTRRVAARQAYDTLLAQACRAVEVPNRLEKLPEGVEREVERLRVEQGLRDAGLLIP